eukprot:3466749-Rhodomonas_salina.1
MSYALSGTDLGLASYYQVVPHALLSEWVYIRDREHRGQLWYCLCRSVLLVPSPQTQYATQNYAQDCCSVPLKPYGVRLTSPLPHWTVQCPAVPMVIQRSVWY